MTNEEFCLIESVRSARDMSFQDSVRYLRGLVLIAGDHEAAHSLRQTVIELCETDAQLELIASGQLKLPLEAEAAK